MASRAAGPSPASIAATIAVCSLNVARRRPCGDIMSLRALSK